MPGGIHYVSPNKDSRGAHLPKRTYKGEHKSLPVVRSEVLSLLALLALNVQMLAQKALLGRAARASPAVSLNRALIE